MTDLSAALLKQFLHVSVTQRTAVIEPDSVLDDRHRDRWRQGLGSVTAGQPTPTRLKQHNPLNRFLMFMDLRNSRFTRLYAIQTTSQIKDVLT